MTSTKADKVQGSNQDTLFYELSRKVLKGFEGRKTEESQSITQQLEKMIPFYKDNWNYGNAKHRVNIAKGRIALQKSDLEEAKRCLLEAGKSKGSPQLNSFGPNMTLVKELLLANEPQVVVEYLKLTKNFWEMDRGKIDDWIITIEKGRIPDFGTIMIC